MLRNLFFPRFAREREEFAEVDFRIEFYSVAGEDVDGEANNEIAGNGENDESEEEFPDGEIAEDIAKH